MPHYAPDTAATGEVITRVSEELVARGHTLYIITSLPWYSEHQIEPAWKGKFVRHEETSWGKITRVHPFPAKDKRNLIARALSFIGFTALVSLQTLKTKRVDAVLAMSPPLTLAVPGWIAAKRHRVPMVLNLQDVYPDVAIDVGVLKGKRIISLFRHLEHWSYKSADAVTVLSEDLRVNVASRTKDESKVRVIPNFVDIDRVRPCERENAYRKEFDLTGKMVVMYAGNIGYSQPLDLMLDAAKAFSERTDLVFVINGGGGELEGLKQLAHGLDNVLFVPMQDRDRLPEVLGAADIHVICLKTGLAKSSVPSKLYSILASARPVLASVDIGSEVARIVESAGAGITVAPDDPLLFVKGLTELLDDESGLLEMGEQGLKFVEAWTSPGAVAASYEELFEQLIEGSKGS